LGCIEGCLPLRQLSLLSSNQLALLLQLGLQRINLLLCLGRRRGLDACRRFCCCSQRVLRYFQRRR